ncbi:TetR/AcrR family transcriptional regulator [Paenibacillus sp. FSL R7-0337]|uniref:TetR/AcrR family transcriptional regulator n=1 Tax=unclassified Paenibacillus TaxID=185978 RepID=UPI00096CD7FE|nr:TetR/AcrR family transcriptional regulator [Paenibacillus sp. FSL R7-0337]OMF93594.1 TetR family transcriptional regulator [Paenibacillus sp. FSL R7-0337]
MTPRTKEQNEDIRLRRLVQIRKAAADVFLNKGPLLEIRDVAAEAGLGYGTVYHYYSNKGDLLHDLLWDALDRAGEWLKSLHMAEPELPLKIPLDSSAAGVRLLQLWAEDHAIYLLCKQAGEGFPTLPEARSSPLIAEFRREVLTPLSTLLGTGLTEVLVSHERATVDAQHELQHTEMLLAALVGCAALSLRRGQLNEDATEIVRILKL